jgi:16S rRNA (guanine1207-N2)-methyltransferase
MAAKGSVGAVAQDPPGGHYFDVTPTARSAPRTVRLDLPDLSVELSADRGVFSAGRVDPGTRLLLLEAPRPSSSMTDVLDLGCGYGPITVALATRAPNTTVWGVDINERALHLTAENATRLGLDNVRAVMPHDVPSHVQLDGIWSNPPVRIGKVALHELLVSWLDRLRSDAHAYLVVQKHLGADSLQRWLGERGWPTERRRSRAGYRLLDVAREQAP